MINLIPPAAKRTVIIEYWVRVVSVWMVLLGTACLITATLLLPTYMMVRGKLGEMEAAAAKNAASAATFDSSAAALTRAMAEANLIMASSTAVTFTNYETDLMAEAGTQIEVTELQFVRLATTTAVTVVGTAKTRAALAAYREALEANVHFFEVQLPLSSLVRDRDLPFTMMMFAHNTNITP